MKNPAVVGFARNNILVDQYRNNILAAQYINLNSMRYSVILSHAHINHANDYITTH